MTKNKLKNLLRIAFEKLYYYLAISVVFDLSFLCGLGIFSFATSHIVAFNIYNKLANERYKEKVKIFKILKENLLSNLKENYKMSLIYILLLIIISLDIFYFSAANGTLYKTLFYIFIILIFVVLNAMIMSFFIKIMYPSLNLKENIQNSISLIVVNIVDILLLDILIGITTYFLNKISFILLILVFPGIYIELTYYVYKKILEKKSISYLLFNIN